MDILSELWNYVGAQAGLYIDALAREGPIRDVKTDAFTGERTLYPRWPGNPDLSETLSLKRGEICVRCGGPRAKE